MNKKESGLTIEDMEKQRLTKCSFYPFALDDQGNGDFKIQVLMRKMEGSDAYLDFGTEVDERYDSSIFFSAARSYLMKTAFLCSNIYKDVRNNYDGLWTAFKEY